jgi:hypothetical protein
VHLTSVLENADEYMPTYFQLTSTFFSDGTPSERPYLTVCELRIAVQELSTHPRYESIGTLHLILI